MRQTTAIERCLGALLVGFGLAAATASDKQENWPEFRGSDRDGISSETGLLDAWPTDGPKEVWRVPLGEGYSAISVVGDRLYTMYAVELDGVQKEVVAAFGAGDGSELWRTVVGDKYDTEFGNGPRSTPTVVGDTVYALGSQGDLVAVSAADGAVRWRLGFADAFGSKTPTWGFSMSPLAEGKILIVEGGGPEGKAFAGIDRATGEVVWTSGEGRPGYNSPLKVTLDGTTRFVHVSGSTLRCMDVDGNEVWSRDWPRGETHAMPVLVPPDRLFASGAEGVGAKMFRMSDDGIEMEWESRFMRNHFSSSVHHEGTIFGFDNATLKAIAAEDGSMAWAKRGLGKGSLILADGRLIVLSDSGQLLLVDASADEYRELGRVQALEGRCWTAPVLSGGRLYLRNHEEMVAFDLKG